MYKRALSSNILLCFVAAILLVVGIGMSINAKDFLWFSRFGALVICTGVIALARPSITGKSLLIEVGMDEFGGKSNDPEYYRRIGEPIPPPVLEDVKSQRAVGVIGPLLCLLGTSINGFGELLNRLLDW